MDEHKNMEMEATEEMVLKEDAQENALEQSTGYFKDNRGVGVIEIVLILVILIGLVLIFKDEITDIVNTAFESISGDAEKIIK